MNSNIEQTLAFQQGFSNFELFSSVLRGYQIDLQQLDHGTFSANIQQIQFGDIFIGDQKTSTMYTGKRLLF